MAAHTIQALLAESIAAKRTRARVYLEIRNLVRTMAVANPIWGAPRIQGELLKLGIEISARTVSRLMPKKDRKPTQTWMTFLRNHVGQVVSIDFFTVATVPLRVLYVFIVLAHDRRRVLHFNVTEHPTVIWAGQQIIEAFPEDTARRFMVRDRDGIYGESFRIKLKECASRRFELHRGAPGRMATWSG
jgi:putative transposase